MTAEQQAEPVFYADGHSIITREVADGYDRSTRQ
jgi:hypothetical protein